MPLEIYTDSKGLFDVITKCSQTQERRIMIDLQAVQGAYKSHETSNVSFIRGPNNPADGMTKPFECTPSHDLLRTGKANFTVEQLVIRSTNTTVRSGLASGSSNANDDSTRHLPSYHEQVAGDQIQSNCNTECTAYYRFIASHPELSRELLQHYHAYNSIRTTSHSKLSHDMNPQFGAHVVINNSQFTSQANLRREVVGV